MAPVDPRTTAELIQRVEELDKAATQGPWQVIPSVLEGINGEPVEDECRIATTWHHGQLKGPLPVVNAGKRASGVAVVVLSKEDATLIAEARTLLPEITERLKVAEQALQGGDQVMLSTDVTITALTAELDALRVYFGDPLTYVRSDITCPLCEWKDGKRLSVCATHADVESLQAENAALKEQVRLLMRELPDSETGLMPPTKLALQAENERLKAELKKLKEPSLMPDEPHNWTGDRTHENGNYMNKCMYCEETFMGHKRRVACRVCASPVVAKLREKLTSLESVLSQVRALVPFALKVQEAVHESKQQGRDSIFGFGAWGHHADDAIAGAWPDDDEHDGLYWEFAHCTHEECVKVRELAALLPPPAEREKE